MKTNSSTKKYDVAIAFRMYPSVSKKMFVHSESKLKLVSLTVQSLERALEGLTASILVINDGCSSEFEDLFDKYIAKRHKCTIVRTEGVGNSSTFSMQIQHLMEQNDSNMVFFAEDDYLFLLGALSEMISLLSSNDNIDFVSPYDHSDYYTHELHDYESRVLFHQKRHWRESSSTCLTFLTTKSILKKKKNVFETYVRRNYDVSIWMSLTKKNLGFSKHVKGFLSDNKMIRMTYIKVWYFTATQLLFGRKYVLCTPIPSLATHMEEKGLALGQDWNKVLKAYQE